MGTVRRQRWGSVSATLAADHGLAFARYEGELAQQHAQAAAEAYAAHVRGCCAAAGVVDYTGCADVPVLPGISKTLQTVARKHSTAGVPLALVVKRDHLTAWERHARRLCGAGLLRAVFVDHEKARRWAVEMASLYAAQATFRLSQAR